MCLLSIHKDSINLLAVSLCPQARRDARVGILALVHRSIIFHGVVKRSHGCGISVDVERIHVDIVQGITGFMVTWVVTLSVLAPKDGDLFRCLQIFCAGEESAYRNALGHKMRIIGVPVRVEPLKRQVRVRVIGCEKGCNIG